MTLPTPIIHVVDDDESLRTAVTCLLRAAGYQVRSYPSAQEFLLTPPANTPGCVVLDVQMPGPSGLDLQAAFGKLNVALPIIFLTAHGDIPMTVRALKAGAVDFLTKPAQMEVLLNAVQNALALDAKQRTDRERRGDVQARFEALTLRQREVCALVVTGKLNKQIAAEIGISERAVKFHQAHVMEKLEVTSVAELVHLAEQLPAIGPAS
jgi:FixJ family two-component response regulator